MYDMDTTISVGEAYDALHHFLMYFYPDGDDDSVLKMLAASTDRYTFPDGDYSDPALRRIWLEGVGKVVGLRTSS